MKALKFLTLVIATFAILVACERPEQIGQGNNSGNDTTTTNPNDTTTNPVEEKTSIDLVWGGVSEVNGKTYEVGMANYDPLAYELVVDVVLKNNTDEEKTFTVKEVRNYDLSKAIASLCVSVCMPGDMNVAEQVWSVGKVGAGEEVDVALHLTPLVSEATTFPAEFTFSDGTDEVKFTVNYNYTPAE